MSGNKSLKGSKLGLIPADWKCVQIKDLVDYVDYRGRTPKKSEHGVFLVTAKNIRQGRIDYESSKEYIPVDSYKEVMARGNPKIGDVLITTEAPMGVVAPVDREDIALAQRVIKYRSKSKDLNQQYLLWFLQSPSFQNELNRESTGSTVQGIKGSRLHKIPIAFPPLPEQRKIAEILSTWDEAIRKTEELIELKEKLKKGLMQQLLTGKKRLPGFESRNSNIEFKSVKGLGGIPVDWRVVSIKEVATEKSERNGESGKTVLSCSKYDGFVDSLSYFGKRVYSNDLSNYKVIYKGQFGFPSNHVEEGSIGLLTHRDEGLLSPIYVVFEFNGEVDNNYAFQILKTEAYRHLFEISTSGSVDRRGSLRWKNFSNLPFPLPSIEEQRAISGVIDLAQKELSSLQLKKDLLARQKKGLMQQLLIGKIRVK